MSAGKGSSPRPFSVPRNQYESQHEKIFGKRTRERYIPPPIHLPYGGSQCDEMVMGARGDGSSINGEKVGKSGATKSVDGKKK